MNPQNSMSKYLVIDQSFKPLISKFHGQPPAGNFDLLKKDFMGADVIKKHEAIIGLRKIILGTDEMVTMIINSGLIFQLLFVLKEGQFAQLGLQSIQILFTLSSSKRICDYILDNGGIISLLNALGQSYHRVIAWFSAWTMEKIFKKVAQKECSNLEQKVEQAMKFWNENEEHFTEPDLFLESMAYLSHSMLPYFRPQDNKRFFHIFLQSILKNKCKDEETIKFCLKFLSKNMLLFSQYIQENGYDFVRDWMAFCNDKSNSILRLNLLFLGKLKINESFYLKKILIQADCLGTFTKLLDDENEQVRIECCGFIRYFLGSFMGAGIAQIRYFLSKNNLLVKLYYLLEHDSIKIKKLICLIFSSLSFKSNPEVFQFYRSIKIVSYYLKMLKQHGANLISEILISLFWVLQFTKKMDMVIYQEFLSDMKKENIREMIKKVTEGLEDEKIMKNVQRFEKRYLKEQLIEEQ